MKNTYKTKTGQIFQEKKHVTIFFHYICHNANHVKLKQWNDNYIYFVFFVL